jgi:predicted  nucleic acid-binding Zn-ribbon protein
MHHEEHHVDHTPHDPMPGSDPAPADENRSEARPAGEDVMGILADVEQRLSQIRRIQHSHDEQELELNERERRLAEAECRLEDQRSEFDRRNEDLTARERSLEEQREKFTAELHEVKSRLAEHQERLEQERAQVDAQRDELNAAHGALDEQRAALSEQEQRVQADRAVLDQQRASFDEQRDTMDRERAALEARQAELTGREQELARRTEELDSARAAFDEQARHAEVQLAQQRDSLTQRESELEERHRTLEAERVELEQARAQLDTAREDHRRQVESLERERQEFDRRVADAEARAAELAEQAASVTRQLEEAQSSRSDSMLELAQARARDEELSSRISELERELTAAREAVERAESDTGDRIENLAQERDAARGELETMRSELEQARSAQTAENDALRRLDDELQVARAERESATAELKALTEKLVSLEAEGDEARKRAEQAAGSISERDRMIEQLNARVTEAADQVGASKDSEKTIADLRAKAEQLNDELALLRQVTDEREADAKRENESLRQQVERLERQLEESADATDGNAAAQDAAPVDQLRVKAKRLQEISDFLRVRHERLRKVRRLIREKGGTRGGAAEAAPVSAGPSVADRERHSAQLRHLEQQRHQLFELRQSLAVAEKKMVRRWARPHAYATVGWILIFAVISAGVGWLAAGHFFPATVAATATLEAKNRFSGPVSDEEAEKWRQWHTGLLVDSNFHETVARRMQERRLDAYGTAPAVARRLASDLTRDSVEPTSLTLTLAGDDRDETMAFLDILVATIVSESDRQLRKRSGNAWAAVRGERQEQGVTRYCTLNPVPIKDERLKYAGPIAGVTFLVLVLVVCGTYFKLIRAKRIFEDDDSLYAQTPSAIRS